MSDWKPMADFDEGRRPVLVLTKTYGPIAAKWHPALSSRTPAFWESIPGRYAVVPIAWQELPVVSS